jgi:hypothetical protein
MAIPIVIIMGIGMLIFIIYHGIRNVRATLGIPQKLRAGGLTVWQSLQLSFFGLKTPILDTLATGWTFVVIEGDQLNGFSWEQIMSREHAAWVAAGLWVAKAWSHFSGLQIAAATPPVISPLPGAIEGPPRAPQT